MKHFIFITTIILFTTNCFCSYLVISKSIHYQLRDNDFIEVSYPDNNSCTIRKSGPYICDMTNKKSIKAILNYEVDQLEPIFSYNALGLIVSYFMRSVESGLDYSQFKDMIPLLSSNLSKQKMKRLEILNNDIQFNGHDEYGFITGAIYRDGIKEPVIVVENRYGKSPDSWAY